MAHKGKLETRSKVPLKTKHVLSFAYTPVVAEFCREISKDRTLVYKYMLKANSIAIVTDGLTIIGLGNICGYAAIPVMEGKIILFKEFAWVDAFRICFENYETDFINLVKTLRRSLAALISKISLPQKVLKSKMRSMT